MILAWTTNNHSSSYHNSYLRKGHSNYQRKGYNNYLRKGHNNSLKRWGGGHNSSLRKGHNQLLRPPQGQRPRKQRNSAARSGSGSGTVPADFRRQQAPRARPCENHHCQQASQTVNGEPNKLPANFIRKWPHARFASIAAFCAQFAFC